MNHAGTIAIVIGLVAVAAAPADAGKKKSKRAKRAEAAAKATQETPAPRRLSDELGFGIVLASPTPPAERDAEPAPSPEAIIEEAPALALGEGFDLLGRDRDAAMPTGDGAIRIEAQPLTEAQVGAVVKANAGELEYCYRRIPASRRPEGAISLQFTVEPRGSVVAIEVGGEPPASLARCIEGAAKRWTFPIADTTSIVEYPIVLK